MNKYTRRVSLFQGSKLDVYDTDIDFFIQKILNKETFSYYRMQVEYWMLMKSALSVLGYNTIKDILSIDRRNIPVDKLADLMIKSWNTVQRKHRPWRFQHHVFSNIVNTVVKDKPEDFYFAVSDRAFHPGKFPPAVGNVFFDEIIKTLLPDGEIPFNAVVWRRWGQSGEIQRFFNKLRSQKIVLVGPYIYKNFGKKAGLPNFEHIQVHNTRGCEYVEEYKDSILNKHQTYLKHYDNVVYLYTCGCVGLWLIRQLHGEIKKAQMIDVGRGLDAYLFYDSIRRKTPSWVWGEWLVKNPPEWAKKLKNA